MASTAQWVAVCVPTGTGDPNAFVGPTTPLRCTMPSGAPGSTHLKLAYLSDEPTNWQELGNMSIENAHEIGGYVAVVWAIAWSFRAIRNAVLDPDERGE